MEVKNYLDFEHYCIFHHIEEFKQNAIHWSNVSEEMLYESGFIHSHNESRMTRKKKNEEGNKIYREYGLDGLSIEELDNKKIYHGIQAKYWGKKKLTGKDLGTFQNVIFNRLKRKNILSKGYLYHTNKIQSDLNDDIKNSNGDIITVFINKNNLIQNNIKEINYKLHNYQIEAIEKLGSEWYGIKSLILPCGTGKTVIYANHLKNKKYKNIIIVSPLKIQAYQSLKRVSEFLIDYKICLFDSDKNGTFDVEIIKENINKNILISTTFMSFPKLIEEINLLDTIKNNSIIIVDEAHNIIGNKKITKYINYFNKCLLVTATPPSQMNDIYNCDNLFKLKMKDAIDEGFICDYNIYIPYTSEIPNELITLNSCFTKKSLFLLNGMLLKGSSKCIVYMKNKNECHEFKNIINKVNELYHFIDLSIDIITSDISYKDRNTIIDNFNKNENKMKLILSVRILDEGIDVPLCDSIFISYFSTKIDNIRTIQRMCRANRKNIMYPTKKANCFLWIDEFNSIIPIISLLKENDIDFYKKISTININYDNNSVREQEIKKALDDTKIIKRIEILSLTPEEKWMKKYDDLINYISEKGFPKNNEYSKWISNNKSVINKNKFIINNNITQKWIEFMESYSIIEDKEKKFLKNYYQCQKCFEKFNSTTDIKRHLDKKNKCKINVLNKKFDETTYIEFSLQKRNIDGSIPIINKNYSCQLCYKKFSSDKSLKNHIKNWCKNNNSNNINSNNINININNNKIDLRDFMEETWDTSHIDNVMAYHILNSKFNYTNLLEYILLNHNNLNVYIENIKKIFYVFNKKKDCFEPKEEEKVMEKSVEKLALYLLELNDSVKALALTVSGNLQKNIEESTVTNEDSIKSKYFAYVDNDEKKKIVNDALSDIFDKTNKKVQKVFSEKNTNVDEGF